MISEVESYLEDEREIAVNSPMPAPETAEGGVYCEDGCHEIKPRYGIPKQRAAGGKDRKAKEAALHFS